jgi:acetyl esterase/lipase
VYFHGGFWAAGNKEGAVTKILPWMEMGWNVVNVEYRLARVAPAPAAVEDCLCALRYLAAQAKTYMIDVNKIVVTGESAGGHLSLTSAMIPESAGLDRQCAGAAAVPKPAAAINWFGITDVNDVIDGPNRANAAMTWFGSLPDRAEIARRVSPLTYVRAGLPPILSIHGDADRVVPYQHAVRLSRGAEQSRRAEPTHHHSRRRSRQLHTRAAHDDLRDDSRVPDEEQGDVATLTRRWSRHTLCQTNHGGTKSMRIRVAGVVIVAFVLAAAAASAHHSVPGQFDTSKPIKLKGVITKIDWINPHIYVHLAVKEPNGATETWALLDAADRDDAPRRHDQGVAAGQTG